LLYFDFLGCISLPEQAIRLLHFYAVMDMKIIPKQIVELTDNGELTFANRYSVRVLLQLICIYLEVQVFFFSWLEK
jgi:hypothetical protein